MAPPESFGHFLLPLTMNKGHIDVNLAKHVFEERARYLQLKEDRPERHAIRNLLGMLAFRFSWFEEAFRYLDHILSDGEDPDNLNALANRKYMCEKLLRFPEARYSEKRIAQLLAPGGTEEDETRRRKLRARSMAEQAFAYSFDLFEETVTCDRYLKTVNLYERATELAGSYIDREEKEDWTVVLAMACRKIYMKLKLSFSTEDKVKPWFQRAVESFMLIVQSSENSGLVSDSWRNLGELFTRSKHLLPSIPNDMKTYVNDPEKCFAEALSISPDDPRILARYAGYYQRQQNYSDALSKVNSSISLDNTVFNCHAYYIRAALFIEQYKKELQDFNKNQKDLPNSKLLTDAKHDLKFCLQYFPKPWQFQALAEVFYYMAIGTSDRVLHESAARGNLQLALTFCAQAVACQDGQKEAGIHKLRGECLCTMGEHRAALGCFKRAVECKDNSRQCWDRLIVEYKDILEETSSALPDYSPLLADMFYWLHKVAEKHLHCKWKLWYLNNLKQLREHWTAFVKYCDDNDHKMELASIELAATEVYTRPTYPQVFQQSSPDESSTEPVQSGSEHDTQAAVEMGTVQASAAARDSNSSGTIPAVFDEDVETAASSLAAVGMDEAPLPSDIHRTGKTQHVSTTPSIQDTSTDAVHKKHIRSAPDNSLNCLGLTYDFFVIYSRGGSEWVQRFLLEELEGTGLKGCIKDRDFLAGTYKVKNYEDSINNSSCTIVVITKDFESENYCVSSMLMALQSTELVIPVLLEARKMPFALKHITYLNATGHVDWARLERSIEQRIKLDVESDEYKD